MQKKILVVDDDLDLCYILQTQLSRLGYDSITAVNGREAVDLAVSQRPDLIVMDIVLPVMDGLEATRLIREHPDTQSIPILAMTAKATSQLKRACLQGGCNDFIAKPFTTKQLTAIIEAMFEERSSQRNSLEAVSA
ncbi:MAG TPA: response regulator [Candidatus Binatia bacterium]